MIQVTAQNVKDGIAIVAALARDSDDDIIELLQPYKAGEQGIVALIKAMAAISYGSCVIIAGDNARAYIEGLALHAATGIVDNDDE
jgi:hypothetical protein